MTRRAVIWFSFSVFSVFSVVFFYSEDVGVIDDAVFLPKSWFLSRHDTAEPAVLFWPAPHCFHDWRACFRCTSAAPPVA